LLLSFLAKTYQIIFSPIVTSEVKKRKDQLSRQLDRAHLRLALMSRARYANEGTYKYQRRRAFQLVVELEDELSMLSCPGEYAELAVATVADELGLTSKQVRSLIRSGEIEATGNAAHERISRAEMERIAALGGAELLRLGRQESAEIFEEAVPYLQDGDLEFSERAYRRLKGREGWGEAYAPAFLLCLEIAKGELESARDSIRLIHEYEDMCERTSTMACVRRILIGMHLKSEGAGEFRELLLAGN
jgi:hypothetical protein